jgi:GntR family transcriptional regulator/MocR family aminotransferase
MARVNESALDDLWQHLLQSSEGANPSLQSTLRMNLAQAMLDGRIPGGTRLPSTRFLANRLKVARITVALAYEALASQGFIVVKKRSGHFVRENLQSRQKIAILERTGPATSPDWSAHLVPLSSEEKWLEKPRIWQKYKYPFVYGQMDMKLFPLAEWRECSRLAQATPESSNWASDAVDVDDGFLVEQLCTRVLPRRGITASPDEVLITVGSQMGVFLLSELLIRAGTTVAVEDPGYMDGRNIFLRRGANILPLSLDESGAIPPNAIDPFSCAYLTPSHQCPTGATLSTQRRLEWLNFAERQRALLIEDDYDAETQFNGPSLSALKAMDRSGRVIYLSSLSKTFAPGLRIGYMVADRQLIHRARHLRRLILRHTPNNNQRTLALFIAHGHYELLLTRYRSSLASRARQITESLRQHLPAWHFREPRGGSALWVETPQHYDTFAIEVQARKKGVLIESGASFFRSASPPNNFARLAYSTIAPELIDPGVRALARAVREQQRLPMLA